MRITAMWNGMDRADKYLLISSVFAPLLFWWIYIGRHKYSTKGMR